MKGKTKVAMLAVGCLFGAQSVAHANSPLLQLSDLVYQGAFRVPKGNLGGASLKANSLAFGGSSLAFNTQDNSLLMVGNPTEKLLVEISIPTPKIGTDITTLQTASVIQPPIDPTNGNWNNLASGGTAVANGGVPGGFLIHNNRLIGTSYASYNTSAVLSHFVASPNWKYGSGYQGFYQVGTNPVDPTAPNASLVGGYMTDIPTEWQSAFGGPALTGMAALSIISRTSSGPAVSVFDPDTVGAGNPAPATMLLGYPSGHYNLGRYDYGGVQPYYNSGVQIRGVTFPAGTSSVLFFGRYGYGTNSDGSRAKGTSCYGRGTTTLSQAKSHQEITDWFAANPTATSYTCGAAGIVPGEGNACCYDTVNPSVKGPHNSPYVYRVWAYDANDLVAVKDGLKQPWEVLPYATWDLNLPFSPLNGGRSILGAAYDPATQRLFVSQDGGDSAGLDAMPLIHVFSTKLSSTNDVSAPTTMITAPLLNAKLIGEVPVTVLTKDNVGVTRVEFYVNGALQATSTTAPFSFTWDTTSVANGVYTLLTKAYDATGNVGESSAVSVSVNNPTDTTPPLVSAFSMPASSNSLTVPISTLSVSDNVGVTGYLISESSTVPTASDARWSAVPPASFAFAAYGARTAYLWAKDAAGNVSVLKSAVVTITQVDTMAPTITLFAPGSSCVFGSSVAISAAAKDNVGVTRMEVYVNGMLTYSTTSASFSISYNFRIGSNTVTVKAYDGANNVAVLTKNITRTY